MSRRVNRPTAFEQSFGLEEAGPLGSTALITEARRLQPNVIGSLSKAQKRRTDGDADISASDSSTKRLRTVEKIVPKPRYIPHPDDIRETADLIVVGEEVDNDFVRQQQNKDKGGNKGHHVTKPIRNLSDFTIYNPGNKKEIVSLDLLDADDENGHDRQFEAAGLVTPVFQNEEDEGQEDDLDDGPGTVQRLCTTAIFRYTFNYIKFDDPIYIETEFAWYILRTPSQAYRREYFRFYRPRRIVQMIASTASANEKCTYDDFCEMFLDAYDSRLERKFNEDLIRASVATLVEVVENYQEVNDLAAHPLIRAMHGFSVDLPTKPRKQTRTTSGRPRISLLSHHELSGNRDIDVLRPEKQNPTHVTPYISTLAEGLFPETLVVIGPRADPPNRQEQKRKMIRDRLNLVRLLQKGEKGDRRIHFHPNERLGNTEYWKSVHVEGVEYKIGDVIITTCGKYGDREVPVIPKNFEEIPTSARIPDFFWFGKIVYIKKRSQIMHVVWFEHSSKTVMQEIFDPQELFLTHLCGEIEIRLVVDKAIVHYVPDSNKPEVGEHEYYYKLMYNDSEVTFTRLPEQIALPTSPPDNCPNCLVSAQQQQELNPCVLNDDRSIAYLGTYFHYYDYVLICSQNEGPATIGFIVNIRSGKKARDAGSIMLTVRLLGRISDFIDKCPPEIVKDPQHLFFTDIQQEVPVQQLVRRISVIHPDSCPHKNLASWLSLSPYHFYVKYHFPQLETLNWDERSVLTYADVKVCWSCSQEELRERRNLRNFKAKNKPLRAFDPFGGVGTFALGMAEAGCIEITHAVEISPSAAKTLKKNSPETSVYNQCANVVLLYAIKSNEGHYRHANEFPKSLGDGTPLPDPPKPKDIDCIIAGFPCQPHSRLNKFQKADDRKSHLILNLLSWVDFLKPNYCFFENVRGFMKYNLNAKQAGKFRVEGGIETGGLKFLIRAMIALDYQVRFGLLQAAHYGTPQSRVRFFLIAAKRWCPLPELPEPTHNFPLNDALEIKFPNWKPTLPVKPVRACTGVAPYQFVSIDDAISDLPRFDWKFPGRHEPDRQIRDPRDRQQKTVQALPCDPLKSYCGFAGPNVEYFSQPRTAFQQRCRARGTTNLLHITKVLKTDTVKRVVSIPLTAKADYRSLTLDLWEWQISNPSSAVARGGFRPGLYGRLDQDGWFRTTVTNVEPTAKQSWVLNPYCKRVVTVRELARSQGFPDYFIFCAPVTNDAVKTMHRQIGNAVPWEVAVALGRELRTSLLKKWVEDTRKAQVVE